MFFFFYYMKATKFLNQNLAQLPRRADSFHHYFCIMRDIESEIYAKRQKKNYRINVNIFFCDFYTIHGQLNTC